MNCEPVERLLNDWAARLPRVSAWRVYGVALAMKLLVAGLFILPQYGKWTERFDRKPDYDDIGYLDQAQILSENRAFMTRTPEGLFRTVYRTPGYPFLLAGIGRVTVWHPLSMILVQGLILSLIPVVFLRLLRGAGLEENLAWLMAADPLTNLLSMTFMTEGWLVLAILLSLSCLQKADAKTSYGVWGFLLWSCAILVKPSVQYYYLVLGAMGLIFWKSRARTLGVLLVGALPLLAWGIRNHGVTGRWELSTQMDGSIVMVAAIEEREGHCTFQEFQGAHAPEGKFYETIMDNKLDYVGEVGAYVREHPILFVKHHLAGDLYLLFGTARNHVREALNAGARWTRLHSRIYDGMMLVYYMLIYVLVAAALWLGRPNWKNPLFLISAGFVLYNLALIGAMSFHTGGGLKRVPMMPFIFLLLALGLQTYQERQNREGRRVT